MNKHVIKTTGFIAAVFAFVGCAHTPNTIAEGDRQHQIALNIDRNGELSLEGKQCPQSELAARLAGLTAKQQMSVIVRADAGTSVKQLITVMDSCKTAGVQHVNLATIK